MAEGVSKRELAQLKKAWADADMPEDAGDLPDGKYQFEILTAEIAKAGSGRLQSVFSQKVVGGDEDVVGEEVKVFDGLDTGDNIGWFKRKLTRLGFGDYDLDDFETVKEILDELPGTVFEGQVKHKDGFMNLYVNRLISAPEEKGEDGDGDGDGDGEPAEEAVEVGDEGTAPYEGESYEVVVTEVGDDVLTVQNAEDEDDTWEVGLDEFEPAEEEGEEGEEGENGEDGEDGEDGEGEGEGEEERFYPTLDELGKMPVSKLKAAVFEECGLKLIGANAKSKEFARELAMTIVSIMEDDDYKPSKEALAYLAKNGARKAPAKTFAALEQQVIDWLNDISSGGEDD